MSRSHRRNLKRGDKQPLGEREQRVRASRHGKEHRQRARHTVTAEVPAGTPGAKRSVEERDGQLVVVHRASVTVTGWAPVTKPFPRRVPVGPTGSHGQRNDVKNIAPRGKAGAKP